VSGPPEDIEASELWQAITAVPRPSRAIEIPRKNAEGVAVGQVAIWPLSQQEQMEVNAAAERFAKDSLKAAQKRDEDNLGYHHTYGNESAVQTLYRACRNVADLSKPAFPSPKAVRMTFTGDEIGVLYGSYLTVQRELGPLISTMTIEEMEAWIARLAEGSTTLPFEELTWDAQRALVHFMAISLAECWISKASPGSPPDVSTSESSSEPESSNAADDAALAPDDTEAVGAPDPNAP
jgi:hypothetical protein